MLVEEFIIEFTPVESISTFKHRTGNFIHLKKLFSTPSVEISKPSTKIRFGFKRNRVQVFNFFLAFFINGGLFVYYVTFFSDRDGF